MDGVEDAGDAPIDARLAHRGKARSKRLADHFNERKVADLREWGADSRDVKPVVAIGSFLHSVRIGVVQPHDIAVLALLRRWLDVVLIAVVAGAVEKHADVNRAATHRLSGIAEWPAGYQGGYFLGSGWWRSRSHGSFSIRARLCGFLVHIYGFL
ncbi:MAG: hypothetical protein Q7T87_01205 [Polaromonas sp.]|nr:hypothetical protein [Polaromonas sp.]